MWFWAITVLAGDVLPKWAVRTMDKGCAHPLLTSLSPLVPWRPWWEERCLEAEKKRQVCTHTSSQTSAWGPC